MTEYSPRGSEKMTILENASNFIGYDRSRILKEISEPKWEKCGRVHDWRNYIPEFVQKDWKYLTLNSRAILFVIAEDQANREDWD